MISPPEIGRIHEEQVDAVVFIVEHPRVGPGPLPDALAVQPVYEFGPQGAEQGKTRCARSIGADTCACP